MDINNDKESSLEVQRFAINYDPPTFVIEYRKNNKLYVKRSLLQFSANAVS